MSGGGSASKSESKNKSQQTSFVDPAQQPYLDYLRSSAQGAFGGMPSYQPLFQQGAQSAQNVNQLAGGFTDPMQYLQGSIGGLQNFDASNPYAQQLGQMAGNLQGNSSAIEPVIGTLGEDINRQLQRMLGGAGGVNTASALGGTLGGGRNQVSTGLAQEAALQQFGQQAGQLRLADYQQRQQLAQQALGQAGGLYGQGVGQRLGAMGVAGDLQGQALGSQLQQGLGAGTLYGQGQALAMSPFTGQLGLYEQLARILGQGGTVLGQGTSKGSSNAYSMSGYGGVTPGGGGG